MKAFFQDIFEYHHHFNQILADIFIREKDRISERTIPLFSHTFNAHQIWNSRILGKPSLGVNDVHNLEYCKELDRANLADTLQVLADFELDTIIQYRNSRGDAFENSVQEILFQIANHFTHHRGQLVSDLRQQGIVPPVTDYIFYKR